MEIGNTPNSVHLKSAALRVLAHPLRSRLLTALRVWGPDTSTGLADRLGTNTGATSYHLRKLADVGLVEEDTSRGVGRERWWSAVHEMTSWNETEFLDDPDDRAAADWLMRNYVQAKFAWTDDWVATRGEWSREWRAAANSSDYELHLTPEDLAALNQELHDVIMSYRQGKESNDGDRQRVVVIVEAFPSKGVTI